MTSLRVLSYNVRSLRDDVAALTRAIRDINPDVAIIQEAPRFLRWRSSCAALARRAGLVQVCGGRIAGANLILSTLAVTVIATDEVAFSHQRNLHRRGAALAVLELAGCRFTIAGTHLDLIEEPRLRHLDELASAANRLAASSSPLDDGAVDAVPLIVGGDMNAVPGSATWARLTRFGPDSFASVGTGDGFSYSAVAPVRRIDGFFADPRLDPVRAQVPDSADIRLASDHRPLLVEYQLL